MDYFKVSEKERESVLFLHEKIKEFKNLILQSSNKENKKNNLNEINQVLGKVINLNEDVNCKLDKLIDNLIK